ncbi:MAG: glutamine-hydrolyzing carbamoyl-phosphate synthase small subunit [Candidatus Saganbacteria bacterium]|nr:glutamine-hydrolyzing carbamoyl-phosphate synthase small subunit [Candidatus Saganbacteria bacterium]
MYGVLVLEDGMYFEGEAFGAEGVSFGEAVFNTSMTGYQEILTDPSYKYQIITMTCPLIGNYGVNKDDMESLKPHCSGFVVREKSNIFSNWRAETDLDSFLKKHNVIGLSEIDTRALTRHIRSKGAMKAVISSSETDIKDLHKKVAASASIVGMDLVKDVSCEEPYSWEKGRRDFLTDPKKKNKDSFNVVVFDFGVKFNILRKLHSLGCKVTVVPAGTKSEEIFKLKPDGILLSNGPGDPKAVAYAIETVQKLVGKFPIFGICLGHQILSLAFGGKTYKLKFGHRGANHPVKNLLTGRIEITSQNHGFAVDPGSFRNTNIDLTHINLNDGTCEGLCHKNLPAFSVQYHPEASPGPHDSEYLFTKFIDMMKKGL